MLCCACGAVHDDKWYQSKGQVSDLDGENSIRLGALAATDDARRGGEQPPSSEATMPPWLEAARWSERLEAGSGALCPAKWGWNGRSVRYRVMP